MTVTILDFYADWCGPCKTQDPILEQVEEELDSVEIRKVDVDDETEKANEYQVRSIPTLIVLDADGDVHERFVGVTQKKDLVDAVNTAQ